MLRPGAGDFGPGGLDRCWSDEARLRRNEQQIRGVNNNKTFVVARICYERAERCGKISEPAKRLLFASQALTQTKGVQ